MATRGTKKGPSLGHVVGSKLPSVTALLLLCLGSRKEICSTVVLYLDFWKLIKTNI